jgi:type I restriction enzyme M protein
LPDGKLGELVDLVSTIGFGADPGTARDVLGQVYEYFLGQFASAEGKKGGQFYTPASIVKTLVAVLAPHHGKVYDPCCGSGGMFVQSEKFIEATAASWATCPSTARNPTPPPGAWPR